METQRTVLYRSALELIGNTPLLLAHKYAQAQGLQAELLLKLEAYNPGGSVKDRVALSMLDTATEQGLIRANTVIIEPTSGNTGIGLALVCAVRGLRLILTMPESMSAERRKLLAAYGAELVLTPAAQGMAGAVAEADRLAAQFPSAFVPGQFANPANPAAHSRTAAELWQAADQRLDAFVAGVGTGGTIMGLGGRLREYRPGIRLVAVEPAESPLLSKGQAASHPIQGIGANFVPELVDPGFFDEIITVSGAEAKAAARALVQTEGVLAGISSGAALYAATQLAKRREWKGKRIAVMLPDGGERYLSTDLYQA